MDGQITAGLRSLGVLALALALGHGLTACGSNYPSSTPLPTPDAGPDSLGRRPCLNITECQVNEICLYSAPTVGIGYCTVPDGTCTGPQDTLPMTGRCFPESRCDLTGGRGQCTFSPPPQPAFPAAGTVVLDAPGERTAITAADGFSLQWEPGVTPPGTVTVALIMDAVPVLDAASNRLSNVTHIRWIWSSADPGGPVQNGAVPLRYGATGLTASGALRSPRWNRDTLPDGTYWWFVYGIQQGAVVTSSNVTRFHVGAALPAGAPCSTADMCVSAGDFPETAACVTGHCMRRCASDEDCAPVGSFCDFTAVPGAEVGTNRHEGFCGPLGAMGAPSAADAGPGRTVDAGRPDGS